MFQFKLPDIGEGVVEGEIVSWKVAVGDTVAEDQPLVEVMTDKATVEIPSPRAGTVTDLRGGEGDVIEVGSVFVVLDEGDGDAVESPASAVKAPDPTAKSTTSAVKAPDPATKSPASAVKTPEPAAKSPASAVKAAAKAPPANGTAVPSYSLPSAPRGGKVLATPATRRIARELSVELARVPGTGTGGRITKSDVIAFSEGRSTPSSGGASLGFTHSPVPPGSGPERRVKLIGLRRKISEQMVRSALTIPHFCYVDEVDMTDLVALRRSTNQALVRAGHPKVSYLPFIMKALLVAFRDFPEVNALFDNTTGEVVYKDYFHCGLATDTDRGLFVSVVKGIDRRSIAELGQEIVAVTERVRSGKASPSDLHDSTFTITSIGNIGGLFATPIINYPEVAILGVNKIMERPMVRDGAIVPRHMMHLSPSFDHRIVDGANAARFTSRLKELLENPGLLMAQI